MDYVLTYTCIYVNEFFERNAFFCDLQLIFNAIELNGLTFSTKIVSGLTSATELPTYLGDKPEAHRSQLGLIYFACR